jgi:hypothetical protein
VCSLRNAVLSRRGGRRKGAQKVSRSKAKADIYRFCGTLLWLLISVAEPLMLGPVFSAPFQPWKGMNMVKEWTDGSFVACVDQGSPDSTRKKVIEIRDHVDLQLGFPVSSREPEGEKVRFLRLWVIIGEAAPTNNRDCRCTYL